jgi:hypothetical protein
MRNKIVLLVVVVLLVALEALATARLLAVQESISLRGKWKEWARGVMTDLDRAKDSEDRWEAAVAREAKAGQVPSGGGGGGGALQRQCYRI